MYNIYMGQGGHDEKIASMMKSKRPEKKLWHGYRVCCNDRAIKQIA